MTRRHLLPLAVLILLSLALGGRAQDPPATAPAPRYEAQVPPGFMRARIEGRNFFLDPADERWVRPAVEKAGATTVPSTMPADVLGNLRVRRDALRDRMMRELALTDPAPINEYFDERLLVFLRKMDEYRPSMIYLIVAPEQLKRIMKDGWTDRRFHYNRAADDVSFMTRMNLALDSDDDVVVPLLNNAELTEEERGKQLAQQMHALEGDVLLSVAGETLGITTAGLIELISTQALVPLKLKPDQEWFAVGVAGVLAAQYVAELSGMTPGRLLDDLTTPVPNNPIRAETLDLLHPTPLADLRREWLPAYVDAFRRRSMSVVRGLIERAGDDCVAQILEDIRRNPPADGPALVSLIRHTTGVDLTGQLKP